MPIDYARRLTGTVRTRRENTHLGVGLAFVAGATNAGAFLAVSQYTSHMTGIISSMADALVLGQTEVFLTGVGALCAFTGIARIGMTKAFDWNSKDADRHFGFFGSPTANGF